MREEDGGGAIESEEGEGRDVKKRRANWDNGDDLEEEGGGGGERGNLGREEGRCDAELEDKERVLVVVLMSFLALSAADLRIVQ